MDPPRVCSRDFYTIDLIAIRTLYSMRKDLLGKASFLSQSDRQGSRHGVGDGILSTDINVQTMSDPEQYNYKSAGLD